jgi:hypothetical protein
VNERIDEEIGALLDGRVPEPRRTELLTRLAADDADYDVFADTAAVLREAEEEESAEKDLVNFREAGRETPIVAETPAQVVRETPVTPLRPRRALGWRSPAVRALAAAAVLAAIAVVPMLRSDGWASPQQLVALASPARTGLSDDWGHSWTTRGAGGDVANLQVAARIGALHLDLEVTARAAGPIDPGRVARLANAAAATLGSAKQTGPSLVSSSYGDIAKSTHWTQPELVERLADARNVVLEMVDRDYFAAGAWTEAARIAGQRRNAAFFRAPESRKALERTLDLEGLNFDAETAARLRAVMERGEVRNWTSLQSDLDTLLARLTR